MIPKFDRDQFILTLSKSSPKSFNFVVLREEHFNSEDYMGSKH